VFVTGGSRGIGAAAAERLGRAGKPIAVGYITNADQAQNVVDLIVGSGGTAIAVQADVSNAEEVERAFDEIERSLGPVGILVNNAGIHRGGYIRELSLDDWRTVLDTSLTGSFLCSRRAVTGMIELGGGRIVQMSSVIGIKGFAGDVAYSAAKAGAIGLAKALALELARFGISVNAIAPGFVDTDMTRSLTSSIVERIDRTIPARRWASPDEIAAAIEFLATGPAYITGTVITVDGGWTISSGV
jgi:3-oxoacyl-[acyl-carrier protein] reductase